MFFTLNQQLFQQVVFLFKFVDPLAIDHACQSAHAFCFHDKIKYVFVLGAKVKVSKKTGITKGTKYFV
jgi:exoribonuclease II